MVSKIFVRMLYFFRFVGEGREGGRTSPASIVVDWWLLVVVVKAVIVVVRAVATVFALTPLLRWYLYAVYTHLTLIAFHATVRGYRPRAKPAMPLSP